jgi:hypothetical protein
MSKHIGAFIWEENAAYVFIAGNQVRLVAENIASAVRLNKVGALMRPVCIDGII